MVEAVMLSEQNCKYKKLAYLFDLIPPFYRSLRNKGCI